MNIARILEKMPAHIANGHPSEDTVVCYRRAAKFFFNWVKQTGKDADAATEEDAAEYRNYLHGQNIGSDGINQRIAGAKAAYRTAINIGEYANANPFTNIKGEYHSPIAEDTNYFTVEEMKAIFRVCETLREQVIILLMGVEGLRTVEVARLNIEDIDFKTKKIRVHSKGGRTDYIFPSDKTRELLSEYIGTRKRGTLVVNEIDGSPISRQGIRYVVNRIFRRAGLKERGKSCHALRHSCGTNLYAATKNLRLVQETLRHREPKVTTRYTHITRENATNLIAEM